LVSLDGAILEHPSAADLSVRVAHREVVTVRILGNTIEVYFAEALLSKEVLRSVQNRNSWHLPVLVPIQVVLLPALRASFHTICSSSRSIVTYKGAKTVLLECRKHRLALCLEDLILECFGIRQR